MWLMYQDPQKKAKAREEPLRESRSWWSTPKGAALGEYWPISSADPFLQRERERERQRESTWKKKG